MSSNSCNRAFGNIAMVVDDRPTQARSSLAVVEAGTADFDYMLATMVFDLMKKNALLHKALREYALHADPEVAEKFLRDVEELDELEQDYEALAHRTEEMMLEAIEETGDDHRSLARTVVRWNNPQAEPGA